MRSGSRLKHRSRAAATALIVMGVCAWTGIVHAQRAPGSGPPKAPLGLPPLSFPLDNPWTPEKEELGYLLYFDPRLSADSTVSCATCHAPDKGFADDKAVSTGIKGLKGTRNSPTIINRAYSTEQFWDGRAATLEEQAKGPIANPVEMTIEKDEDRAHQLVVEALRAVPGYRQRFLDVFGTEDFTIDHVAQAIATFERTVLSGNSPYDRYMAGDKKAMTPSQIRGMNLFFGKALCSSCHNGPNFTDERYSNIGVGMDKPKPDLGRYTVTRWPSDKGAFKTPTLRDCVETPPYFHDGSAKTLEEVMAHYIKGGTKNQHLDPRIKPLQLTGQDVKDLVAFMHALNGEGWRHIKPPAELPQ